jgi:pimeloyl-ACP methyl ester carboxylesterase
VVLFNTGLLLGYRWHTLARIWRTPILGELFNGMTTRPAFRFLIQRSNKRPLPREFVDRMYDEFDRGTKRAVLDLYRATNDPAGLAARSAPRLRELDRPALVIWGKHDPYLGVELVERQREAFPRAETVVLDESGHWAFADDPERVADAVLPFLRRQLAHSAQLTA